MTLRLQNLEKAYPSGFIAVNGVSLDVEDGEFFTLLGPSGCGKTTTLRMIAGLETPSAGKIFIGGRDFTDTHPRNRDVAMVFPEQLPECARAGATRGDLLPGGRRIALRAVAGHRSCHRFRQIRRVERTAVNNAELRANAQNIL